MGAEVRARRTLERGTGLAGGQRRRQRRVRRRTSSDRRRWPKYCRPAKIIKTLNNFFDVVGTEPGGRPGPLRWTSSRANEHAVHLFFGSNSSTPTTRRPRPAGRPAAGARPARAWPNVAQPGDQYRRLIGRVVASNVGTKARCAYLSHRQDDERNDQPHRHHQGPRREGVGVDRLREPRRKRGVALAQHRHSHPARRTTPAAIYEPLLEQTDRTRPEATGFRGTEP